MKPTPESIAFLTARKAAYQAKFGKAPGVPDDLATADLKRFCRANSTCFDPDPRAHAALEGRREVYLRIQQHLELTVEQLAELYGAPVAPTKDTDQ